MKFSNNFANVAKEFVAMQHALQPIAKDAKNDDIGSKYATFNRIIETARPVMREHGFALLQSIDPNSPAGMMDVESMLLHNSGEWVSNNIRLPIIGRRIAKSNGGGYAPLDPQAGGSAISYGKRYGFSALVGIVTEEDDDGRKARARVPRPAATAATAPPPPVDESLMPVGKKKGEPIKDMTKAHLNAALDHCRDRNLKDDARIIAKELTRRAMEGDKAAEETLREASRAAAGAPKIAPTGL